MAFLCLIREANLEKITSYFKGITMKKKIAVIPIIIILTSCSSSNVIRNFAKSSGEVESGYTYVPIDPFPVDQVDSDSCRERKAKAEGELLRSLPDNAVRMLVEQLDVGGKLTYGASQVGSKHEKYRITVDYINADTINVPVWISRKIQTIDGGEKQVPLLANANKLSGTGPDSIGLLIEDSDRYEVRRKPKDYAGEKPIGFEEFNIPVYIGIGLRVSANVNIIGSSANISGIGVIGAEAEANKISGSLVVQTLGVNGKSISAALPIQSELNRTTAQNAIVAVGSIKALLYEDDTVVFPRVVGLYLPFRDCKIFCVSGCLS